MFKISVVEDDFDARNTIVNALNEYSKSHDLLFQIAVFDNADSFPRQLERQGDRVMYSA